jgi:general secretion pathway protein D
LKRFKIFLVGFLVSVLLAGCAAEREFREGKALLGEGKVESGLAKLEEASKHDSGNHEYRSYFFRSRDLALTQLLAQADGLRGKGQLDEAEAVYQRILGIDANHPRAKTGVAATAMDRRHVAATAEAEALINKGDVEAAQAMLNRVLQENPNFRDAVTLRRNMDERMARDAIAMPKLKASLKKPVTLEFRDANLKSVFEVISRSAGVSFIFDKEVRSDLKATLFVKNTSIEDAIKLLLVTNQLEMKALNDSTVLIYPNTPAKTKDYQELMVKNFYLANTDAKQALALIKIMVKTRDVFIDEKLNLLVMRDTPEAVRLAEKLLANLDLAEPEVMLEVEVLEVSSKRLMELGVNWPNRFSVLSTPQTSTTSSTVGGSLAVNTNTTSGPLTLESLKGVTARQIGVPNPVLNLRKEDGDTNVLANPRIRVKNREKAKIHIGDRLPVITTTSTANVGVAESVSYLDVGLKLDVEPNVYLENDVAIKVGLEVSNVVSTIKSANGTTAYQVGTRNATTFLRLKDGETQVLAGLINDEDRKSANKVPGLGDLPLLGRLFSSRLGETNKNEIVLLITPRVVRNIVRPEATVAEFMSGTEAIAGAPPITLKPVEPSAASVAVVAPHSAPASAPAAPAQPEAAKADDQGLLGLTWQGPAQARVGEPFTLSLNMASDQPVSSLPLVIGYDHAALQAVAVSEGGFLKQNNAQTQFSQRVDQATGRIFVGMGRAGGEGAKGRGQLLSILFKPLQEMPLAQVQLLSLSADGEAAKQLPLPVAYTLTVAP